MTRRVAIGPVLLGMLTAACTCGRNADGACDDPALWYEPDGPGVYWGCAPPEGWTITPPHAADDTATAPGEEPEDQVEPKVVIPEPDAETGLLDTFATGATALTGATASTGDTALLDTGLVDTAAVPADTLAPLETGVIDTAAAGDTVPDTSAPLADTAAAPAGQPPPGEELPP